MGDMLWERTINFLVFWGIWLLVPLLVDFSTAFIYLFKLFVHPVDERPSTRESSYFPLVTLVIPVHNSEATLHQCLHSILRQSYPLPSIQVICVNNGGCDNSFEVFCRFQQEHRELSVIWTSLDRAGKSIALNAGMYSGQGDYMINVDADTWLDRDAVLQVVRAFEDDSSLVAATGSIRVDKELGKGLSFIDMINYCEVIEYLIAFDIGRRYQTLTNTVFTLSGAFSAFRRDIILQSFLYQERTVSEDTDLTFHIRKAVAGKKGRIGCVTRAIAYVEPVESLARLYSQRVRWQRGEIEVLGTYYKHVPMGWGALLDFTGRILIADHTLAFSRLAWTFLLPFLYLLGYALPTVIIAMMGMFVCYILLECINFAVVYKGVTRSYRKELQKIWWVVFFMPFYRYLSYWFRMAGIILGVAEQKSWRVENPVDQLAKVVYSYGRHIKEIFSAVSGWGKSWKN